MIHRVHCWMDPSAHGSLLKLIEVDFMLAMYIETHHVTRNRWQPQETAVGMRIGLKCA
jgi:hypothetical protein